MHSQCDDHRGRDTTMAPDNEQNAKCSFSINEDRAVTMMTTQISRYCSPTSQPELTKNTQQNKQFSTRTYQLCAYTNNTHVKTIQLLTGFEAYPTPQYLFSKGNQLLSSPGLVCI